MKSNLPFVTTLTCFALVCCCAMGQEADLSEADSNSDGTVTVAEFQEYASGRLQGFDKLEAFAVAVDADTDGKISKSEFENRLSALRKIRMPGRTDEKSEADDKSKSKEPEEIPAEAAFRKLKKLIADSKWKEASRMMTDSGRDELVIQQVISSIGLTTIELPMPMPGLDEAIDEVDDILIKYKLDDLDIDLSHMFRIKMSMGGEEDENDGNDEESQASGDKETGDGGSNSRKKMDSIGKQVLAAVEKSGKRWEIVNELWDAKKSSPFSMSPLAGQIKKHELKDDLAFLVVSLAPASTDENQGIAIQMVAPPTVVRMKKVGDQWKYDGPDPERTNKAMKEFMEKNQGRFGGPPPRNDF